MKASAIALCIALAGAACAHRPHVDLGDEYVSAGDWDRALVEYELAVRQHPNDADVHQRVARARLEVALLRLRELTVELEAGRWRDAADRFERARELAPTDPGVEQGRRLAIDRMMLRIESALASRDVTAVYPIARAMQTIDADASREVLGRTAIVIGALAAEAEARHARGDARILDLMRGSLDGSLTAARARAWELALAHRAAVTVRAESSWSAQLLTEEIPRRAALTFEAPHLVQLDVATRSQPPSCDQRIEHRSMEHRFRDGTELVPNPERPARLREVQDADNAVVRVRHQLQNLERDAQRIATDMTSAASDDPSGSRMRSLQWDLDRVQRDLNRAQHEQIDAERALRDAERRLRDSPTMIERDRYSSVSIPVAIVTRSCAAIDFVAANGRERRLSGMASTRDEAHSGHSYSGLPADPLIFESGDELLIATAYDELAGAYRRWLDQLAREHAQWLVAQGNGDRSAALLSARFFDPEVAAAAWSAHLARFGAQPRDLDPAF